LRSSSSPVSSAGASAGIDRPVLSIVSPVYGCAGCLAKLCERIEAVLTKLQVSYEVILVCDASPDDSWERIVALGTDPRIRGLRLTRNFGQHLAISAGLQLARGEWIVVMDCDLQDQPEAIASLWHKAQEGHEVVFAQRHNRKDGLFKRLTSRWFYGLLGYLTDSSYDASTANFGIFSARVVATINSMPEGGRFFPLLVHWTGFKRIAIPVEHAERLHGKTSYRFGRLVRLAIDVIVSYSDKPLRLVAKLGLGFALLSFFLVAFSLYRYYQRDIAVAGYTSILASIWAVGGIIISCLGMVGIYIGRVFTEIKRRPHYIVAERVNAPDSGPDGRADGAR
jgi:glycosyltransferase involved in cell wall biosynthesis